MSCTTKIRHLLPPVMSKRRMENQSLMIATGGYVPFICHVLRLGRLDTGNTSDVKEAHGELITDDRYW